MSQRVKKLPSKGKGEDGTQTMSKLLLRVWNLVILSVKMLLPFQVQKESAKDNGLVEVPKVAMEVEYNLGMMRYNLSLIQPPKHHGLLVTSQTSKVPISTTALPPKPQPRYLASWQLILTESPYDVSLNVFSCSGKTWYRQWSCLIPSLWEQKTSGRYVIHGAKNGSEAFKFLSPQIHYQFLE